jgi:hypothetical protein
VEWVVLFLSALSLILNVEAGYLYNRTRFWVLLTWNKKENRISGLDKR